MATEKTWTVKLAAGGWGLTIFALIIFAVLAGIAFMIITISNQEPRPDWSIIQSKATELCYEVYRGRVLDSQVPCP